MQERWSAGDSEASDLHRKKSNIDISSNDEELKNLGIKVPQMSQGWNEKIAQLPEPKPQPPISPKRSAYTAEQWPNDVKFFQPYEVEQILLPDNASCLATQAFLKMCKLKYSVEPRANAEAMSPSGKVPFIKVGAFIVSELEGIVQFVNSRGISLTDKLDNEQKADMRAYMSLVHNVLENAELYVCWCDKETYNEVTSVRYGSIYPWPLNHMQNYKKRNAVIKKLSVLGWYEKTIEDVFKEVDTCCQALQDRLENKEYFFEQRTELDALVFGHLCAIRQYQYSKNTKKLAKIIDKYDNLLVHNLNIFDVYKNFPNRVFFNRRVRVKKYQKNVV